MKKYIKNIWEDRIVQYPNRYKDQNDNLLTLTQEPGEVAQVGTLVEAERMNNIEDGIETVTDELQKNIDDEWEVVDIPDEEFEEYTQKEGYLVNEPNKQIFNGVIPRYEAKLLWSKVQSINADFKAQTITIDKKYKIIDVVYTSGADAENNPFYKTIRCYRGVRYNLESVYGGYIRNRAMFFSSAGSIVFGDGYLGNSGSLNIDNHQCTPHFIYGVAED